MSTEVLEHPNEILSEPHPGSAGHGTDWPGEWHSPAILLLTIEGVRCCSLTAGSCGQRPQPHRTSLLLVVSL